MKLTRLLLISSICYFMQANDLHYIDHQITQIQNLIKTAASQDNVDNFIKHENIPQREITKKIMNTTRPIFKHYPQLSQNIGFVELATLPTPVNYADNLSNFIGKNIYIKSDDLTGKIDEQGNYLFGGNKVRKLEFLFGEALRNGCQTVITFGCTASNHKTATATYAKELGLKCFALMKPQPNSNVLRRNLLLDQYHNAEFHYFLNNQTRANGALKIVNEQKQQTGNLPYIIPTGGSCPIGILGFVNAAFELKEQVDQNILPLPDKIYVPIGSCGTVVGLLIGVKAAKLNTKIIAVTVEPEEVPGEFIATVNKLFNDTNNLLCNLDSTFPKLNFTDDDLSINYNYSGTEYGLFTNEGVEAIKLLQEKENINLDGTYTAKAMAALLNDAKRTTNKGEIILFWNTYCGMSFENIINKMNYKNLPEYLHIYFEEDVQPLDRI